MSGKFDLAIKHGKSKSTVKIKLTGADELIDKLNRISKDFRGEAGKAMVGAGALIIDGETQKNINETFSDKNTGGLKNSVSTSVDMAKPVATVAVNKIYARIQEFGGTVVPKKAKALHFVINGQDIFVKKVTIPARPYFRPAIESSEDKVVQAMSDVADLYLKRA